MRKKLIYILIMFTTIHIAGCKTSYKITRYDFVPEFDDNISAEELTRILSESDVKSISLKNDSTLIYWKRYGGLGKTFYHNYKLINDKLITDSIDVEGIERPEISNMIFLYSKDKLINQKTNEVYYNEKLFKKK